MPSNTRPEPSLYGNSSSMSALAPTFVPDPSIERIRLGRLPLPVHAAHVGR